MAGMAVTSSATTAPASRAGRDHLVFAVSLREKHGAAAAGALWMPWQRRGDFQRLWRELAERHDGPRRVSWKRVRRRHGAYFAALVDAFFATPWLRFRVVVDPGAPPRGRGDRALEALLAHAIVRLDGRGARHRVRVASAARVAGVPLGAAGTLREVDEQGTPGLQLARLLTGAVRAAHGRGGRIGGDTRRALAAQLAARLGVAALAAAGAPADGRFQVWLPGDLGGAARG
jgi:hypothetical protein